MMPPGFAQCAVTAARFVARIEPTLRERHSLDDVHSDAAGVPLPAGEYVAKSGEMFPCMDCPCGCNRRAVLAFLLLHTLADRMDWAHEHRVRPPSMRSTRRGDRDRLCWLDESGWNTGGEDLLRGQGRSWQACCSCHHDAAAAKDNDRAGARHRLESARFGGQSMKLDGCRATLIVARLESPIDFRW